MAGYPEGASDFEGIPKQTKNKQQTIFCFRIEQVRQQQDQRKQYCHGLDAWPQHLVQCLGYERLSGLFAFRIRGIRFYTDYSGIECPKFGVKAQDVCGLHSLCCARGENTTGHYCVRDRVLELVHLADSSAVTKVRQLFPDTPNLRPAGIFKAAALPGRMAALDVGICCPDASGAGSDCCDSMFHSKVDKYRVYLDAQSDFEYRPLVFSCYGRVHPEAVAIFETLARSAARKHGVIDHKGLLARLYRNIGVEIWKRAASMVYDCMPKLQDDECELLSGRDLVFPFVAEKH